MLISFSSVDQTIEVQGCQFNCGNPSIEALISKSYFASIAKQAETQKVCIDGDCVGYYSYTFSNLNLIHIPDSDKHRVETSAFRNRYASVHIEYLAVDSRFQGRRIGTMLIPLVIKRLQPMMKSIPVRYITLNSLASKVDWYKKLGFEPMATNPDDSGNVPMYYDCLPAHHIPILQQYFE